MHDTCELCHRAALEPIYKPERSTRGLTIQLCVMCGLLQSLPRADRAARAPAAVSGGADWGNVRYGKGFRTQVALDALRRHTDFAGDFTVLDVGSNRGSFARALLDAAPHAQLTAVEPDERVASSCAGLPRTQLIVERIENVALESRRFDVVHSCHTIEHLIHPAHSLADHHRALKDGGILVLDAPNTALLASDDIVEEWFIDKHLYHFSARTLTRMIEAAGFTILERPDPKDRSNLLFVAKKTGTPTQHVGSDLIETEYAHDLIATYVANRARNMAALTAVATELLRLAPRRVAMWGAGRLFDSLVTYGRFDATALTLLVDKHLKAHVGERHGCALTGPEGLAAAKPDVVVVMSRDFAKEIAAEVGKLTPGAEIILYSDLMSRARLRPAA
ncbi:MAG TPA: class I SAM-dependent methyltransferase [Rhizomicrobium sp.]|jgi:SAM-dependent methyltransferase|nr:class I SAM-dependent methyltransferase [Rhizomicrobium sp.]